MIERLEQCMELENSIIQLSHMDLHDGLMNLFSILNFSPRKEKPMNKFNGREFTHAKISGNILLNSVEWNCLGELDTLSELFTINFTSDGNTGLSSDQNGILFIGADLNSRLQERSQVALLMCELLGKIYRKPIFAVVRIEKSIVFCCHRTNNMHLQGSFRTYLSDWIDCNSIDKSKIFKLLGLSNENHNAYNVDEYFLDLIYSISRGYYLYRESYISVMMDYFIRGIGDPTSNVDIKFASIKQLAEECFVHHRELYGFDFVLEEEGESFNISNQDNWISITANDPDFPYEELRGSFASELEYYMSYGKDDDISEEIIEKVPEEYFEDPIKLLDFLDEIS